MSLINQMLLDLERRRMSSQERNALPDHVRALPEPEKRLPLWQWLVLGGLLAAMAVAGFVFSGGRWPAERVWSQLTQPAGVPAAVPVAIQDAGGQDEYERIASRLSFDLAAPPLSAEPDPAPVSGMRRDEPLPASRIIDRAPGATAVPSTEHNVPVKPRPAAAPVPAMAGAAKVPAVVPDRVSKPEASPAAEIDIRMRKPTQQQLADAEFARAAGLLQQGKQAEAREMLERALRLAPSHHAARQTLLGVLINSRELAEAEQVLQEGLKVSPAQTGFAMALARLQVDRGDGDAAIETLQRSAAHAHGNAEYLAFHAALLQRRQRHAEAVDYFDAALAINPRSGLWLLGKGVSLQALNRGADAQEAYRQAQAAGGLSAELRTFVEQRLRQIQ